MRYPRFGRAFVQEDGSIDCVGESVDLDTFCSDPAGTGYNAGNSVAGDARCGDCRGQIVVDDEYERLRPAEVCGGGQA